MKRYEKNTGIISDETYKNLKRMNILIIGAGGLGGYLANSLARIGVKSITIVDYDVFDQSNLNRQLFSTSKNIGESKVEVLKDELLQINPDLKIKTLSCKYDESFNKSHFKNIDFCFDAVDNIEARLTLERDCSYHNIPLIHGAIAGWYGQFGIVMPNTNILHDIYKNQIVGQGIEKILKSPTFIPPIVANMMVVEFIKLISNSEEALINKVFYIDLLTHSYQVMYKK